MITSITKHTQSHHRYRLLKRADGGVAFASNAPGFAVSTGDTVEEIDLDVTPAQWDGLRMAFRQGKTTLESIKKQHGKKAPRADNAPASLTQHEIMESPTMTNAQAHNDHLNEGDA